ncbi:MAG: DUF6599 family protein [Planctomycetota bacterium]
MWQYDSKIRHNILAGLALLAVLWALAGCQREQPTASETASPVASTQPAPEASKPVQELPATTVSEPKGVDSKDDLNSPRALPKSEELREWIKTKPIEVAKGNNLKSIISNRAHLAVLSAYRTKSAARCAYGIKDLAADVLLVEAATPADAFGIFSVMTSKPGQPDQTNRSHQAVEKSPNSQIMHGWQGNTYARAQITGRLDEKAEKACSYLFNRILFNTPATNPPMLVQVIPPAKLEDTKIWVVRNMTVLKGVKNEILQKIDAPQMNARLGLSGEELLSVATVPVEADEQNNLIWLVEYADPNTATVAYNRYQSALQSPSSDLDRDSIVYTPQGKVLFGSWTAGQESIQHLLDQLKSALPE